MLCTACFRPFWTPGDEVIIPGPYWLSYPDLVMLSGGTPVIVDSRLEDGYKITPQALKSALSPAVRAVILNSPSNPTGAVYSVDELKALADIIEPTEAMIVSDDVYEKFVYDGVAFANILTAAPMLRDRVVILNSASKTYAMPGWRIGYALGPEYLIKAATRIQGQATSCAGSISQKALAFALGTNGEVVEHFRRTFEARRNLMVSGLERIEGVQVNPPAGAFYVFARVDRLMARTGVQGGSAAFCEQLLDRCQIACVPGKAFGDNRCILFSFVTDESGILEGISRLEKLVS